MNQTKNECEKGEWGGWKIVSDMLDHPDENGIYPTSKCYRELYEFVSAQKKKIRQETLEEMMEKIEKKRQMNEGNDEEIDGYNEALADIINLIQAKKEIYEI